MAQQHAFRASAKIGDSHQGYARLTVLAYPSVGWA